MNSSILKNNLKRHRLLKGLTQEELANQVGVTRKTINVIEAGNYAPSVLLALILAKELSIPVEDLFFLAKT